MNKKGHGYRMDYVDFPDSSFGKESAWNARDPGSLSRLGRSAGEGIGCPLQYSWASLVAQLVKNLPAMWETWVRSLGWEDSPGEGNGYPLQYSGLENSMDCIVHGITKSQTQLSDFHFHSPWTMLFHYEHFITLWDFDPILKILLLNLAFTDQLNCSIGRYHKGFSPTSQSKQESIK